MSAVTYTDLTSAWVAATHSPKITVVDATHFQIINSLTLAVQATITATVAGATLTGFSIADASNQNVGTVTGLALDFATVAASFVNATTDQQLYEAYVGLFDDDTTVTGSNVVDGIEVGAGNDIVNSGGGDDTVFKWKAGNLTYDGGAGIDTLTFQTLMGPAYPTAKVQQLVVNLATGTGLNPYGGTLSLTGVENIVGTDAADQITGDDNANVIGDGVFDGGADIINAAGGNDIVKLSTATASGASYDGGTGVDELVFTLESANATTTGDVVLDLATPGNNTFGFQGVTISNFEKFTVSNSFVTLHSFTFRGTNADEIVTGSAFVAGTTVPNGKDVLNGGGGNDTLNGLSGDDTLNGDAGNDTLIYTSGVDTLDGGADIDTASLAGFTTGVNLNLGLTTAQAVTGGSVRLLNIENLITGSGNDMLNGLAKAGANVLTGGAGNDTYVLGAGDTAIEALGAAGGIDTIQIAATTTLATQFENLTLLAGGAFNGTGNAANNILTGNALSNILTGLAGDDTLIGGAGADRLNGGTNTAIGDTASYAGSNAGVTVNLGLAGAQVSAGHASGDTLTGIENLTGSSFADTLIGNALANRLNGSLGADLMRGFAGNDIYTIDNAGDVADESAAGSNGNDTIFSSIAFSLGDAVHAKGLIENLTLLGAAAISGTGNALANTLNGSLNTGANLLRGLAGNDIYVVGAGDIVDESAAGSNGVDTVMSTVLFSLSDAVHVKGQVENLTLIGTAGGLNATGNALNNVLTGSITANALFGLGGNDTLNAGLGNDFLDGGVGNDVLTGGGGSDTFFFTTALNAATNVDTIADFIAVDDTIRLSKAIFAAFGSVAAGSVLDAAAFEANATGIATSGTAHVVYNTATGALIYDSNGSAAGGATQFATLTAHPTITNADFVIIA